MLRLAEISSNVVQEAGMCAYRDDVAIAQKVTNLNRFVFRCRVLYAPSEVSPAFVPQRRPMLVMLAKKHTRNVCFLAPPSDHTARGVPTQDALARTPLWSTMMKPYPSANGHWDPKQANGIDSGQLALSPQVLICPPPS
ncbi:hypothetical protein O181_093215 [Austropuccinia psidii MF-1]|uniref:Uncharacterized protein n=1 Tax=Austropuccinia psidii MF-1 TaxID=1389203 RepID=A0A9Q3IZX5_9BASI|nr:hypothetical protein [Austropuccinia psidii MF-1]